MKTLMDQMGEPQLGCVALMVGACVSESSFRNYMREVPELPDGFTIGDAARAYLSSRLAALERIGKSQAA